MGDVYAVCYRGEINNGNLQSFMKMRTNDEES